MKKLIFSFLIAVSVISCASNTNVSDFKNKDWKLVDVLIDSRNINFNRKDLINEKAGDIFTLKLDGQNISGTGAPNRYSAPYTLSGKQNIKVKPLKATQMASIWQPEKLKEYEFFIYMQNISTWAIVNNQLEFTSKTDDGRSVKLVFSL
ncbi:MAG: META domain-containing protein [Treponema sp.]|jgi:heat shock protein HslJ|nr:META domain-containing protein [Treponema sp.]